MMSADPVTQDRVYRALRQDYLSGHFDVGARLDLQGIADRLRSSKTPVREAIHRLVGEQLIEADPAGGFRIWRPTPHSLVQLYTWNAYLIGALAHLLKEAQLRQSLERFADLGQAGTPFEVAGRAAAFFNSFAEATGNAEAIDSVTRINERLLYTRIAEVGDMDESVRELRVLMNLSVVDVHKSMRRRLEAYHQRRIVLQLGIIANPVVEE